MRSVRLVQNIREAEVKQFDAIVALDVLEHVEDLSAVYELFLSVTARNGVWIISGPTENTLYRLARRVARTRGEGHVRNIDDVLRTVPRRMGRERICRLPFGLPLFVVALFRDTAGHGR
jgi:hypothetical protein